MSHCKLTDAYRVKVSAREALADSFTLFDVCGIMLANRRRSRVVGSTAHACYRWARLALAAPLNLP